MRFKIEGLGGMAAMQHVADTCANCGVDSKCRRRDFSEQAWAFLAMWKEVQPAAVDQPICESCYGELREVLIDRADEIAAAVAASAGEPTPAGAGGKRVGAQPRQRVRKAG